jgi:hypothetical protein
MRVILFQERFAGLVRSGAKTQTIRKRARCKPGDVLSLRRWTGKPYRSKQEVLREAVCTGVVSRVEMDCKGIWVGCRLALAESPAADANARADGFANWKEMAEWFKDAHGLPFEGELIQWEVTETRKDG